MDLKELTFEREDWLLVGLVLAVAAPFAYPMVSDALQAEPPADTKIAQLCEGAADAWEQQGAGLTCDCLRPGEFDPERFSAGEYIDERTEVAVVKCTAENGETGYWPVRRVKDNAYNQSELDRINDALNLTNGTSTR